MDKCKIERINQLAKKKKADGLTQPEQMEQKQLYKEYLADIKANVTSQMNSMVIEKPDGTTVAVKDMKKGNNNN
ncbi:MAG TPA: DUF896 domain-containing protein [Clostridiales bacterium]|nr:DUF896 domain-containing protein [Clostridiales bacterium]